jgi:hypothetical protein
MPEPVVFIDMKRREEEERKRLDQRKSELELQKKQNHDHLPPDLEDELKESEKKLGNKKILVDPLFVRVRKELADMRPPRVEDHAEGKFDDRSADNLKEEEKALAVVYGILEQDHVDPKSDRFVSSLSSALAEYTRNKALFDEALKILAKLGDVGNVRHVHADQWVRVVRSLREREITDKDDHLPTLVDGALKVVRGGGDGAPPSSITIDLPDLEEPAEKEIVKANLDGAQAFLMGAMLDELKFFQVVDKLVELFQKGMLPLGRGNAGDKLYLYWKESDERLSEIERRNLYTQIFGFPGGDTHVMPNREFNDLWIRFISAVSSYVRQFQVDSLLRARIPFTISQEQVRKSGRDLAANLSLHSYGIVPCAAPDLQKQIKEIIALLSDQEIKLAYGARDMWQVIDQVATLELGGAKNSVRYRTTATSGAVIIRWLANRADLLANSTVIRVLDEQALRNPIQRRGVKVTNDPTDYDLVNACEQWLAVNGIPDQKVEEYSQPSEAPMMTSRPIQIPAIAKDLLESVGVQAGAGNGFQVTRR